MVSNKYFWYTTNHKNMSENYRNKPVSVCTMQGQSDAADDSDSHVASCILTATRQYN